MNHARTKLLIAALVLVLAVVYLASAGVKEGWVYYKPVDEFLADSGYGDARVRLVGSVHEQNVTANPGQMTAQFDLMGETQHVPVVYSGIIPDNFKPGCELVVEGRLDANGVFQADVMMTKCASKYSAEDHPQPSEPMS